MSQRIDTAHRIRQVNKAEECMTDGLLSVGLLKMKSSDVSKTLFIAEEKNRNVALCSVIPLDDHVTYLSELWVAPHYRSRGILRHMLKRVMQQMSAKGYKEMVMRAEKKEASLERMFTSLGFKIYATEKESDDRYCRWRGFLQQTS